MSDKNLRSIVIDFTNDLTKVFPEYAFLWERWLTADDAEYEKLHQHFMAVFPERFFDIMNSNADIFASESDLNVMFLPDVDFKLLFNCEGISENTKTSMWKYLQLLLFTVLGSVKDTANFGDTLNMFSSMDETDLQEKMKETMEGLGDFFKDFSPKEPSENSEEIPSGPGGFKLPKPEIIQEHMKALMEGKLGKLAKELTEEFTGDLKDVFNENEDLSDKSLSDIMANLMKDPSKIMNIMKKITDKLQAKMKSGDISQDELMQEVAGLVEKFKSMGGGEDIMKKFTSGPFAKMFKNMAGGAGLNSNAMAQMGTQSAMKERLRKKMEDKKLKQAQAQAQALAVVSAQASAQASVAPTNEFVIKIGEEKQEKSGLKAPLSDKELFDLFKNDKKDKNKKKGKK